MPRLNGGKKLDITSAAVSVWGSKQIGFQKPLMHLEGRVNKVITMLPSVVQIL